jgi:hypothetical protein
MSSTFGHSLSGIDRTHIVFNSLHTVKSMTDHESYELEDRIRRGKQYN